jgi:hypothetical protein
VVEAPFRATTPIAETGGVRRKADTMARGGVPDATTAKRPSSAFRAASSTARHLPLASER